MSSHRNDRHKSWLTHENVSIGRNVSGTAPHVIADYEVPPSPVQGTRNRYYCPECGTVQTAYVERYLDAVRTLVPEHWYSHGGKWDGTDCPGGVVDPVEDKAP